MIQTARTFIRRARNTPRFKNARCSGGKKARQIRDGIDQLMKRYSTDRPHSGLSIHKGTVTGNSKTDHDLSVGIRLLDGRTLSIPLSQFHHRNQPSAGETAILIRVAMDDKTYFEGALALRIDIAEALGI